METFIQRTTAPTKDNKFYYANNPFYQSGYGMPNCTAYAWGRFYEISGTRPNLSTANAENWFLKDDGYSRGLVPKLGAVICWRKGEAGNGSDGAGHVAIVEQINADGSIVTSESGYGSSSFWWRTTRKNNGNWGASKSYTFQGFIYNPIDFGMGDFKPPDPIGGNRYLSIEEMQNNAKYIYWYLNSKGWTLNAIAGMLGNMQTESTINPGLWQSLNEGNTEGGFGLVQWTPATKLISWATENGIAADAMDTQLRRIIYEVNNGIQYDPTESYPETFKQFTTSTKDPYYLGMAFLANYERPEDPDQPTRGEQADYWFTYLSGINIDPGTGAAAKRRKGYNFVLFGHRSWR